MNRKFWIIFGSIHLTIVVVFLAVYFFLPAPNSDQVAVATEIAAPAIEATSEGVKLTLDLEFDSVDDIRWINFMGHEDLQDANPEEAWKQEGYIGIGMSTPFSFLSVLHSLEPGQFVHFRTRTGENGCYYVGIGVDLQGPSKEIRLDGCTGGLYQASTVYNRDSSGDSIFGNLPLSGSVPAFPGELVDKIIWLNETGDELYYVITNTDDPTNVMVGAVRLPEDWQYDRWDIGAGGFFDYDENGLATNFVDIELIRAGTGSLLNYLSEYVPAYQENQDEFTELFAQEPELMPELHPEGWQEQAEDMGGEDMEMAAEDGVDQVDELSMEVTEDQQIASEDFRVLTWPDPTEIQPYLVGLEDISRCNNCENVVYGVKLSPTDYSFMVYYGNPSGDRPDEDSQVRQWVDIYTDTVDQDEYLLMANIYHYRIPAFEAGEAIQLINPSSAATYLLRIRENVVMMAHVNNAGKNARIANQMLDAKFPSIPEEGLEIPDLVAEPSTELNPELFDAYIERIWRGSFEAGSEEFPSFSDDSPMGIRLKNPVEKLEVAVYDPCSQTYLSYFWMDNPQPEVDLWVMPEKPDDYYFGNYECGEWIIRLWLDGELAYEFPIGK